MLPARIPFNNSTLAGKEIDYVTRSVSSGQIAGDQQFSRRCQALLEDVLSVKKALVTTSCTHALEMSALLLDIKPGDEVIVPSYTFVSSINAFVLRGAVPVFCDIRRDTLNLDESLLPQLISSKTRAIVPVHYAGVGCEMDEICQIAEAHDIAVVEDNAHGLFGKYKGRWLGTMGALGTQSFHETKNITCGEGGALLINRPDLIERAEVIREKGTNRANFFRGQVDKYSWVDIGSSYVMSDVLAAFLYGQLECWQVIQQRREALWHAYNDALKQWCQDKHVDQPYIPAHCQQAWHMYYLITPSLSFRSALIEHLKKLQIWAVFHYLPLHKSTYATSIAHRASCCDVTEDISDRLLRLPFYCSMSDAEFARVIDGVTSFKL